jgi:hypothetical protein
MVRPSNLERAMTETVYIPPGNRVVRRGPFIPPLLIIPFVIYNIVTFLFFGGNPQGWTFGMFTLPMFSGTPWAKSTRSAQSSILEHMLSMLVFVAFLVEFLVVGAAASSVFFIVLVMTIIDVVAGFTVSITSAGRDVSMN